jgi:hypothetical protein
MPGLALSRNGRIAIASSDWLRVLRPQLNEPGELRMSACPRRRSAANLMTMNIMGSTPRKRKSSREHQRAGLFSENA